MPSLRLTVRPTNLHRCHRSQDEKDNIVGHDSKYASHRFIPDQPRGLLHRAFSVFLFDKDNKLLLQQRAANKITFPSLWTNTCCSHPLYGYEPTEVDTPEGIADGSVLGAKRAAVRKLKHELGIAPAAVPIQKFRYLTRLHYCASDTFAENQTTAGGPWGEHEMDYILFIKPDEPVAIEPNREEIDDTKWVTRDELRSMMADPNAEVVAVVPDNLRTISRYVVGRPGRDDRERCARGFGDDPRGDVIGAQRVTRRR